MDLTSAALVTALILSGATGERVEVDVLCRDLATRDVVFLGEEHDAAAGHAMHLAVVKGLLEIRPDLVLSMEMFERDVQGLVDDYLRERIDEELFRKHARPWPNYERDYRPLVELARAHGLDLIAANVPRDVARRVASRGLGAVGRCPDAADDVRVERDRYFDLFVDAMKDHAGAGGEDAVLRMFESQCLKDDTMAGAIAAYRRQHAHRRPLIVHLCGRFHSDHGLGTVQRLLLRQPLAQVAVVSMEAVDDPEAFEPDTRDPEGHYVIVVAKEKPEAVPAAEPSAATPAEAPVAKAPSEEPAAAPAAAAHEAAARVTPPAPEGQVPPGAPPPIPPAPAAPAEAMDPHARPGLGIMPDYAGSEEPGLVIASVREEGAAAQAGLRDKDRITRLNGVAIADIEDYMEALGDLRPGQEVDVVVVRGTETLTLKVKVGVSSR